MRRVALILSSVSTAGAYSRSIMTTSMGSPPSNFRPFSIAAATSSRLFPDGVGADLPDRQCRSLRNHMLPHPRELVRGFLAAYASVEHVDHAVRVLGFQGRLQPICIGDDIAFACRR